MHIFPYHAFLKSMNDDSKVIIVLEKNNVQNFLTLKIFG